MNTLAEALLQIDQLTLLSAVIFLRIGPIVMLFPGMGENYVPVRYKLIISIALAIFVTPLLSQSSKFESINENAFAWLIVSETTIGAIIGVGVRILLLALQTAGSIAAQATSLAMILGNSGPTPMPAIGHLLVIGGLCIVMILGLHVEVMETIVRSYELFPIGLIPSSPDVAIWGIRQISSAFALSFTLSAPFLLVSMLYNVTLGVINKAMPQMMVVFVGAPVIAFAGIFLLFLIGPSVIQLWAAAVHKFVSNPVGPL